MVLSVYGETLGEAKWRMQFPWLGIRSDGVYCYYCQTGMTQGVSKSGSEAFISKPYTGLHPDVLQCHQSLSIIHLESTKLYRESLEWQRRRKVVNELVSQQYILTVDGAFCDALRCLYWLAKQEIPHTTNFSSLHQLCMSLGNTTMVRLRLKIVLTLQNNLCMRCWKLSVRL